VRLIAASHRDLKTRRANEELPPRPLLPPDVFTIPLPPLRERGDDLPMLVHHYLRRFSRELGRDVREIDPRPSTACDATPGRATSASA